MNNRDEIQGLAHAVGDGLSAYIQVHDEIFREAATFKSLLKNLLGKAVPMSKLLEESEQLIPIWAAIQERLDAFRRVSHSSLTPDERAYFDLLSRYAAAVAQTVHALVDRQRLLNEGSRGGRKNPMTWQLYQERERRYESAIAEYKVIGGELNAAAPIIFG